MQQFQRFYRVTVHRKSVNLYNFIRPQSMDFIWLGIQIWICCSQILYIKKGLGVGQKTSQYLVWPPFPSFSMTHLLCIELIRLLIVAGGMFSHAELPSGQTPGEDDKRADELPWDGFGQFVQKCFGCENQQIHQLSEWLGDWSQTILQVKKPDVEVLG